MLGIFDTIRAFKWLRKTNGWLYSNTAFPVFDAHWRFCILHTTPHTHRSPFPLKRSNLSAPWALPYLSHCSEWVKGLCAPKCGCTHKIFQLSYLKLSSDFPYTDGGGYWINLFISLVQQSGLSFSGWKENWTDIYTKISVHTNTCKKKTSRECQRKKGGN